MHTLTKVLLLSVLLVLPDLMADVTHKKETVMKFKGSLGIMMKLVGGGKPMKTVDYLSGDILRSDNLDKKGKLESSQIINLAEEKMINIDHKDKSYTVMTFQEWKEQLQQAMSAFSGGEMPENNSEMETADSDPDAPQYKTSVDFKIETPGDTKKIEGHQSEKVVMVIDMITEAEDPEMLEEGQMVKAGMKITSENWVAKSIDQDEIRAFYQRLSDKLGLLPSKGAVSGIMETIKKQSPQLAEAFQELEKNGDKLDGFALNNFTSFSSWSEGGPEAEMAEEKEETPKSVGGFLGRFAKKKMEERSKKNEGEPKVIMEMETKTKSYSTKAIAGFNFRYSGKF